MIKEIISTGKHHDNICENKRSIASNVIKYRGVYLSVRAQID